MAPTAAPQPWQNAYISALGGKVTPQAVAFLNRWQPWEGGATKNSATNNYFNTEEQMPGSRSMGGGSAVQAYPTLAVGARAFAKTLLGNPAYAPLVNYLRTGQGDPTPGLEEWVSGRTNGNPGYASKILGSHTANMVPNAPGQAAPSPTLGDAPFGVTPTAADSAASGAAAIRQQAAAGFGAEASGQETPMQAFTGLSSFIHAHPTQMPQIHPDTVAAATADPKGLDAQAVQLATKYIGTKYTWGGTSPKTGFDCSGLVQYVWGQMGVNIPRTTYEQWDKGTPVAQAALKPGDEVFFTGSDPMDGKPGHEGMYIGGGKFIEAPGTGMQVRVSSLAGRTDYVGARSFA